MSESNIHTYRTATGLQLVHRPMEGAVGYLGLAIAVGSRHEGEHQQGMAHLLEHMLFKGTESRDSLQVLETMERVGGELNAYTTKEKTVLYSIFPIEYLTDALELIADISQHCTLPAHELEKEKQVIEDEWASYQDSPSEMIFEQFEALLYGSHPLAHPILGQEEGLRPYTQADLMAFYRQHYRPERMVLFSQGSLDFPSLCQSAEELWRAEEPAEEYPCTSTHALPTPEAQCQMQEQDNHQSHVIIGSLGLGRADADKYALALVVNLLGGPAMNSRLSMALRERTGLVYHVECVRTLYAETGYWAIYFGCSEEHRTEATRLALAELEHLRTYGLTQGELEAAKRQYKGQLTLSMEGREQTFLSLGKSMLLQGSVPSLEETHAQIDALSLEAVNRLCAQLFAPQHLIQLHYCASEG